MSCSRSLRRTAGNERLFRQATRGSRLAAREVIMFSLLWGYNKKQLW